MAKNIDALPSMLLEFQNISKSSLLFGATWLVNAYTITAILLLILGANLLVSFVKKINIPFVYALLFLSVAAVYLLPDTALQADNPFRHVRGSACGQVGGKEGGSPRLRLSASGKPDGTAGDRAAKEPGCHP